METYLTLLTFWLGENAVRIVHDTKERVNLHGDRFSPMPIDLILFEKEARLEVEWNSVIATYVKESVLDGVCLLIQVVKEKNIDDVQIEMSGTLQKIEWPIDREGVMAAVFVTELITEGAVERDIAMALQKE